MANKLLKKFLDYTLLIRTHFPEYLHSQSIILCYHCLKKSKESPNVSEYVYQNNCLEADLFESQVMWLTTFCEFVSLDDILRLKKHKKNGWKVAITFDDGYRSVVELGLPIFEKHKIPITWFIATKFVEEPSSLPWWDLIGYILEYYTHKLKVEVFGKTYTFNLMDHAQRFAFQSTFDNLLRNSSLQKREIIQTTLLDAITQKQKIPNNGMVRKDDLKEISKRPLFTFGGHTHSHVTMAKCTEEELESELNKNKQKLKEWTSQEIKYFSYPYGKPKYVGKSGFKAVQKAGYHGAFTTEMGTLDRSSDPFKIPRLPVDPHWALNRFKTRFCNINIIKKID